MFVGFDSYEILAISLPVVMLVCAITFVVSSIRYSSEEDETAEAFRDEITDLQLSHKLDDETNSLLDRLYWYLG